MSSRRPSSDRNHRETRSANRPGRTLPTRTPILSGGTDMDVPRFRRTARSDRGASVIPTPQKQRKISRSEERRVGKGVPVRLDLGGRRTIKKKKKTHTKTR